MNSKGQLKARKKQMRLNIKYLNDKAITDRPNVKQKLINLLRYSTVDYLYKAFLE